MYVCILKWLDKACFQHDVAYGYFKDLHKKAAFDKVLLDKVFKIAENPRDHASMAYKFFDYGCRFLWLCISHFVIKCYSKSNINQ